MEEKATTKSVSLIQEEILKINKAHNDLISNLGLHDKSIENLNSDIDQRIKRLNTELQNLQKNVIQFDQDAKKTLKDALHSIERQIIDQEFKTKDI